MAAFEVITEASGLSMYLKLPDSFAAVKVVLRRIKEVKSAERGVVS